jgi:hypothetical protein
MGLLLFMCSGASCKPLSGTSTSVEITAGAKARLPLETGFQGFLQQNKIGAPHKTQD